MSNNSQPNAQAVIASIAHGDGKTTNHVTNTHNASDDAKHRDMTLATLNKDQHNRLKKTSGVADIEKKNLDAIKEGVKSEKEHAHK